MKFQALIIGNPGERGEQSYCEGVEKDLEAYPTFLRSALGGTWRADEIKVLARPSVPDARAAIEDLKRADYSLGIFCGHGYIDAQSRSTMLILKRGQEINSAELFRGASKQSVILDCCRVVTPRIALDEAMKKALIAKAALDPAECRKYYEKTLDTCPDGLVVMFACDKNETASDDASAGGLYSSSLIAGVREWSGSFAINTQANYRTFSVVQAHGNAKERVERLSGGRQNPNIQKPRSEPYFPFGIVA